MVYTDEAGKTYDTYKSEMKASLQNEAAPTEPDPLTDNTKKGFKYVLGVLIQYVKAVFEYNQDAPILGTALQLRQTWRKLLFTAFGIPGIADFLEKAEDLLWYTLNGFRTEYQFELWPDPDTATYGYRFCEFDWASEIVDFWNDFATNTKIWGIKIHTISGVLIGMNTIDADIEHYTVKRYKWRKHSTAPWSDWIDLESFMGESGVVELPGIVWQEVGGVYRTIGFGMLENLIRHGEWLKGVEWEIPGSERMWFDTGLEDEQGEAIYKVGTDIWWTTNGFPNGRKFRILRDFFAKDFAFLVMLVVLFKLMKKIPIAEMYHKHLIRAGRRKLKSVSNDVNDIKNNNEENMKTLSTYFAKMNEGFDGSDMSKIHGVFKNLFSNLNATTATESMGFVNYLVTTLRNRAHWGRNTSS